MQCVFPTPSLTKGQTHYSTGSQFSTKCRLNIKLKVNK